MRILNVKFHILVLPWSLVSICAMVFILWTFPAFATEQPVPWECSGFTGEAQSRCVRTFTDLQQEKIAKLERDLESQRQTVRQLQSQVTQQASATADLERQLSKRRSRWYGLPSVQIYPPFGLGLRFGSGRRFGGSLFFGSPYYYGPRFYGHGHRRWHRRW